MHRTGIRPAPRIMLVPLFLALAHGGTAVSPHAASPSWEATLLPAPQAHGRLIIEGRVLDPAGRPKRDVVMTVHHAAPGGTVCYPEDPSMLYVGHLKTNILGQYRVETAIPGLAEDLPHVHFELDAPGQPVRTTALRLARCEAAGSDTVFEKLPFVSQISDPTYWAQVTRDTSGDYHARWDLRMAKLFEIPDTLAARGRSEFAGR